MGHLLTVAKMHFEGQEMRNTFWWGGADAVHANAQAIIDEIADAYRDELRADLVDDWELYAFDVYDKTVAGSPGIEYIPAGAAIVGTNAATGVPTQVAMRVDFKASVPKPNTNRKFLAGFVSAAVGPDFLWTSVYTAKAASWAARLLNLPTVTALAVVMEVVLLNAVDGTVIGGNPLTYYRVNRVPSTLRKRKIGVGI
jgi:hypothetical protein